MIRQNHLQDLQMDSIEIYFQWIVESYQTGQLPSPRELIQKLGKGQKMELINYLNESTDIYPADKNAVIDLTLEFLNK